MGAAPGLPHGAGNGFGAAAIIQPVDGDVGALFGQRPRDGRANALLCAGHQRHPARQSHAESPFECGPTVPYPVVLAWSEDRRYKRASSAAWPDRALPRLPILTL